MKLNVQLCFTNDLIRERRLMCETELQNGYLVVFVNLTLDSFPRFLYKSHINILPEVHCITFPNSVKLSRHMAN